MKKYLVLLMVFVFVLLGFASLAKATETFTPETATGLQYKKGTSGGYATSGENKVKVQKNAEEIKALRDGAQMKMDKLKNVASTLRDKVKAQEQQNRLIGRENALARFDNAIKVIESAIEKINAQLPKLKALKIDTTVAENQLSVANNKLNTAKTNVVDAHNIFASTSNELTTAQKDELKNKARETQILIKEAYDTTVSVVKMLREAVKAKKNNLPPTTSGVGGGGFTGGTDGPGNIDGTPVTPAYACSYAPAPNGCTYVKGPNYNDTNSCGMVLSCPNQSNQ